MGKFIVVAIVAAVVGAAAVYGWMVYTESEPSAVDEIVAKMQGDAAEPDPREPTAAVESEDTTHPTIASTVRPTRAPQDAPTDAPLALSTAAPTAEPTVAAPTEREAVVDAFASCGGQYTGNDWDFRARAADSAIADGRQTVADIRALVEEHCGGVLPGVTPVVESRQHQPTPAGTRVSIRAAEDIPTVTATPRDESATSPHLKHIEAKRYMLELINAERRRAGVSAVTMGDNVAAQLHADSSLENCTSSHWGIDGLKPYMRYSLAGGYQSNGENGSGLDYCIKATDNYRAISGIRDEIEEAMASWMSSPGHSRNILNPQHKMVNIGLAWDRYNTAMYQQFEGDYVSYDQLPKIDNGILTLSGTTKNGVRFGEKRDIGVQIQYDLPPESLTRGQVSRTYCYDNGKRVAGLREPLTGGYRWTTHEFTTTYDPCPDPRDVPEDTPGPRSSNEAHRAWQEAYRASQSSIPQTITAPWITASTWTVSGTKFSVSADVGEIIRRNGDGVYSVMVWATVGGEHLLISQYSIFHGITPPRTYDPDGKN